jgi:erythritol kinase
MCGGAGGGGMAELLIGIDSVNFGGQQFDLGHATQPITALNTCHRRGMGGDAKPRADLPISCCGSAWLKAAEPCRPHCKYPATAQGMALGLRAYNQPVVDAFWLMPERAPASACCPANRALRRRHWLESTCQQGTQMAHMDRFYPDGILDAAEVVATKHWMTEFDRAAPDPSEASFNFRQLCTRAWATA